MRARPSPLLQRLPPVIAGACSLLFLSFAAWATEPLPPPPSGGDTTDLDSLASSPAPTSTPTPAAEMPTAPLPPPPTGDFSEAPAHLAPETALAPEPAPVPSPTPSDTIKAEAPPPSPAPTTPPPAPEVAAKPPEAAPPPAPEPRHESFAERHLPLYQKLRPQWAFQISGAWDGLGGHDITPGKSAAALAIPHALNVHFDFQPAFFQPLGVLAFGPTLGVYVIPS
jgi:outer membrane biosynthesis protein TonB